MDKSIARAEELARIGRENDLAEIEYEDSEVKIHLTFEAPAPPALQAFDPALLASLSAPQSVQTAVNGAATTSSGGSPTPTREGETICSPLAGVFYRAPGPDADPYVSESDLVSVGQTLCIVEAMKLMNEINSEKPCKIIKILVENAEAVEEGQALFLVE